MTPASADFERKLVRLLERIHGARGMHRNLFNPYRDRDPRFDAPAAPAVRRENLAEYLRSFRRARWILVGEAAGYNGCRFSGMPFTGEDLLVGPRALRWTAGLKLARSSRRERALSSERSAHIVWGGIGAARDVVLWNTVAAHPHLPNDPLSNRKPARAEIEAGLDALSMVLELFPAARPIAVGRVAEAALARLGIEAPYVRHPSMGGQPRFLAGLRALRSGKL